MALNRQLVMQFPVSYFLQYACFICLERIMGRFSLKVPNILRMCDVRSKDTLKIGDEKPKIMNKLIRIQNQKVFTTNSQFQFGIELFISN